MGLPRFFVPPDAVHDSDAIVDGLELVHMRNVLRLRPGARPPGRSVGVSPAEVLFPLLPGIQCARFDTRGLRFLSRPCPGGRARPKRSSP